MRYSHTGYTALSRWAPKPQRPSRPQLRSYYVPPCLLLLNLVITRLRCLQPSTDPELSEKYPPNLISRTSL